ncbi:unnamed protein product [Urochloa decumbens]|uniref:Uncharacterized protein n=1 Tax=Urochloa decumbens TaxID=240449 RepID=A0ABC9H3E5_9POAL
MMVKDARSSAESADIEEIANAIASDLSYIQLSSQDTDENDNSCQIYRVHQLVRQVDSFAYEPFVLSIGPYHHGYATLQFMQRNKWYCLDYILKMNCTKRLQDYLLAIGDMENQARACYSSRIKLDSKSFRRMLLLDGCFILVYLNGMSGVKRITQVSPASNLDPDDIIRAGFTAQEENRSPENSALLDTTHEILEPVDVSHDTGNSTQLQGESSVQWYDTFLVVDLFLFENQIPFSVVKKIFEVLVGSGMESVLTENVANYIEENLRYFSKAFGQYDKPKDFCHLLHLCHMHFKPSMALEEVRHARPQFGGYFVNMFCRLFSIDSRDEQDYPRHNQQSNSLQTGQLKRWHRATQYHEAGIVFKRKEFDEQNTHSMLDLTFQDGVLEIPCLPVEDRTGALFRNMIAFEQSCPQYGNCITAYVMFMSQLMSSPDDVTHLSRRGIIVHHLHSDKVVSAQFNRLTKGVVFDFTGDFYLKPICYRMEMYYQNRINRWIAWLRHNHLRNPWLSLALLAGLLVLFCTIAQTVLTVLSYTRPL